MSAPLYAVFGDPVAHSLSPRIHQAFAQACGRTMEYRKLRVPAAQFHTRLADFHQQGGCGVNLTVPLKTLPLTHQGKTRFHIDEQAMRAGAVNTLKRVENGWQGFNTDGIGLVRDLSAQGVDLKNQRVLVVGAGGAARGIIGPLLEAGSTILLHNRTPSTAQSLSREFDLTGWNDGKPEVDLIINATSAGHQGQVPQVPAQAVNKETFAYDLSYGQAAVPFLSWANGLAMAGTDGIGMLVEQAAESFAIWHGERPVELEALKCRLRQGMNQRFPR